MAVCEDPILCGGSRDVLRHDSEQGDDPVVLGEAVCDDEDEEKAPLSLDARPKYVD